MKIFFKRWPRLCFYRESSV